jgi:hypothetical protein
MFSQGQLIFAILFFVTFVIVIAKSYKKDASLDIKYYKGSLWILLIFIAFIVGIAGIKFVLGY